MENIGDIPGTTILGNPEYQDIDRLRSLCLNWLKVALTTAKRVIETLEGEEPSLVLGMVHSLSRNGFI